MNQVKISDIDDHSSIIYDRDKRKWFVTNYTNDNLYELSDDTNFSPLLKILYRDPDSFFSEMQDTINKKELGENVLNEFPLKNLIIFCINNRMLFWVDLSINWLKYISLDESFIELARKFSKDSDIDQKLRHKFWSAVMGNVSK
jgi:hypothetical protein